MDNPYPLYPELSEAGKQEAQHLIEKFKTQLIKVANEVLGELYVDVLCHIESDSWTNYRNDMMLGFQDYGNRMVQGEHDFKKIRQQIFKDFREDIIKDIASDLKQENEDLKRQLEQERKWRRERY